MKTINFIKPKVKYYVISGVIIVIGIVAMILSKIDSGEIFAYSLDFMGGTQMEIEFKEVDVPSNKKIEKLFHDAAKVDVVVAPVTGEKKVIVSMNDLSKDLKKKEAIEKALKKQYKVKAKDVQEETISATVSGEMKKDAIVAVTLATIAMLIYIWLRFKKLSFALGSVIPLIHDVFIVLSVYAITQITVGNTFIACLLTLVGYSINATIVIFDRIRESKAVDMSNDERARLVNESISQTFTRSLNTSITTFIMVAVLYVMGVESIKQFTLPLMAGIIAGGYSSVCIAGTIWYILSGKRKRA
jgi:SecD/SecF fusion protein